MAKAEYKSSIRSKNLIKHALIKLIAEKDVEKITITEVIKKSGISRGTFYAHYKSLDEVIEQIETEEYNKLFDFIEEQFRDCNNSEDFYRLILNIIKYLDKDLEYYRSLVMCPVIKNDFLVQLSLKYRDRTIEIIKKFLQMENDAQADVMLAFYLGGIKLIIYKWAKGEINMSHEDLARTITNIFFVPGK